jgi:hypothetical protein
MKILAKVGDALQRLFGVLAETAAKESGVIQRKRKFDAVSLAKTFVLGYLQDPKASDEKLAQMAVNCGVPVTTQAIEQRHTTVLVDFLERLFRGAVQLGVGADKALAPILERFGSVTVIDGSTISLPDELEARFRGCGGSHGGGVAAMKLQTELELRSGAVTHLQIEEGRSSDGATTRQHVRRGAGALRISDLGYFSLSVFAAMAAAGEYFLSRLQFGTSVFHEGSLISVLEWLSEQTGPMVDVHVRLGSQQHLMCRLIAWRLPQEQANRRRQKLRQSMKKKGRGEPSVKLLAWCDWTILVTNVPEPLLTPVEAAVLYRARWQVELLFKRWKSQGLIAQLSGSTVTRKMVRIWARLLAVLIQHWLTVGSVCGDPTRSLHKAYEAVRSFAGRLASVLDESKQLERLLSDLRSMFKVTCRRDKRSKPGTFELLNNPALLNFHLT